MKKFQITTSDPERDYTLIYRSIPAVYTRDLQIDRTSYVYRDMTEVMDRMRFDWNLEDVFSWYIPENGEWFRSLEDVKAFLKSLRLHFKEIREITE